MDPITLLGFVIALLAVASLSFAAGSLLFRRTVTVERIVEVALPPTRVSEPGPNYRPDDGHVHEYDHADSQGWHCGLCNQVKPPETPDVWVA